MAKKTVRQKAKTCRKSSVLGAPLMTCVAPFPESVMMKIKRLREEAKEPIPRRIANLVVGPIEGITQGYRRPRRKSN